MSHFKPWVSRKRKIASSAEFKRIFCLPSRAPDGEQYVRAYTAALRTEHGTQGLRPIQALALHEMRQYGGVFCPIGVGEGKTLISLLAPMMLDAKRPLLVLPAKLIAKTRAEAVVYAEHWQFDMPEIISYEKLGRVGHADFLDKYQPDLIVADECHKLKNKKAAVTRRLTRHARKMNVNCVFMSGSITRRSLHDYAHLVAMCVPLEMLPLPRMWPELSEWADALDDNVDDTLRVEPGAFLAHGPADEPDPLKRARLAFQKRFRETPGIVSTSESTLGANILISHVMVKPPQCVQDALGNLRETWSRPDGYMFADSLAFHAYARQLALGFYYSWVLPAPKSWLAARREWAAFVRDRISRTKRYDTEMQVALACSRGEIDSPQYRLWESLKNTFKPIKKYNLLDPFVSHFVGNYKDNATLIWSEHDSLSTQLAQDNGLLFYGELGMTKEGKPIEHASPHESAILSIAANSEGRNLQAWNKNLVLSCPSAGDRWQQLLARTHRSGQKADEVTCDVLVTCEEHAQAWLSAIESATYLEHTTGNKQKLLQADITGSNENG